MNIEQLKYPIGKFQPSMQVTPELRISWIKDIALMPAELERALATLSDAQMDAPYRPGGWTVRQLVHHIADSHMNAQCRIRLALTENEPPIMPYDQDKWVKLPDNKLPVEHSVQLLKGLHARWEYLLQNIAETDWQKTFYHPEYDKTFTVDEMTGLYAWHGRHHVAQILRVNAP